MEIIVNDRMYDVTRKYLQDKILFESLSVETKERFRSLYLSLTPKNAQEIYDEITELYHNDLVKMKWAFSCTVWKYSAISFLLCGIVNFGAYLGSKYYPNNKYSKIVRNCSTVGLGLSAVAFFTAGFTG